VCENVGLAYEELVPGLTIADAGLADPAVAGGHGVWSAAATTARAVLKKRTPLMKQHPRNG